MAHIFQITLQASAKRLEPSLKRPNHRLKKAEVSAMTEDLVNHRRTSNFAEVPSAEASANFRPKILGRSNLLFEHWD